MVRKESPIYILKIVDLYTVSMNRNNIFLFLTIGVAEMVYARLCKPVRLAFFLRARVFLISKEKRGKDFADFYHFN